MTEDFVKKLLLSHQSNAYSHLAKMYRKEILELNATLFKIYICDRLNLPLDTINIHSLKSAILRERNKKVATLQLPIELNSKENIIPDLKEESVDFRFTNPDKDYLPPSHGIKVF